jgi:hypothetical protein
MESLLHIGDRVVTDEGTGVVVELDLTPAFPDPPAVRVQMDGENGVQRWVQADEVRRAVPRYAGTGWDREWQERGSDHP